MSTAEVDVLAKRLHELEKNIDALERQVRELKDELSKEVSTAQLQLNGSTLSGSKDGAVQISNTNGSVEIGPQNPDWAHFTTDRSKYYFDKEVRVDSGRIGSYDGDLVLSTGDTSRVVISQYAVSSAYQ